MKRIGKSGLIVALLGLAMFIGANKLAKAEGPNLDSIIEGVNISGFVTTFYQWNGSEHSSAGDNGNGSGRDAMGFPNFLMFRDDNSFTLENVEIQVFKEATEEHPVGFGFVTNYGEIARNLTFGGRFSNGDNDNNDEDRVTVQQGYVQWIIPVGKGIDFKIGRFATWIGAELIEDVDNPNLTHSTNYNNSIPFTHSGLSMGYALTDTINITGYFVNGWDTFTDNNNAKSFGWQIAWAPNDKLSMVLNGIHGPEQANNNHDDTHLIDWVGTYVVNDKLSFLANFDYGWTEDNPGIKGNANSDAHWAGYALTAIWNFNDWMNLAVRHEYTDYTDEIGLSIWDFTATLNIRVSENLLIRPEYRHNGTNDEVDQAAFTGANTTGSNEDDDIFAIGFSYIF